MVFLYWLPCVLRMSRPADKEEKDTQKSQKPSPVMGGSSKAYGDLELHQRSSKSLLANVLDLEDNALASHNNLLNNVYSTPGPHHHVGHPGHMGLGSMGSMGHGHSHSHVHTTPHHHHHHAHAPPPSSTPHHQHTASYNSGGPGGAGAGHHHHPQDSGPPQVETILQSACFCARYELVLILKEMKVKTFFLNQC